MKFSRLWDETTDVLAKGIALAAVKVKKLKKLGNQKIAKIDIKSLKSNGISVIKGMECGIDNRFGAVIEKHPKLGTARERVRGKEAFIASGLAIALAAGVASSAVAGLGYASSVDVAVAAQEQAASAGGSAVESVMYANDAKSAVNFTVGGDELADMSKPGMMGYTIRVNGEDYGFFADGGQASAVVDDVMKQYSKPSSKGAKVLNAYFEERVEVGQVFKPVGEVSSYSDPKKVASELKSGRSGNRIHVVGDGETFWDISVKNKMDVNELIAANPQLDSENIKPGDKVNLAVSVAAVSVVVVEDATLTEVIDRKVKYKDDKTLLKGKTKVVKKGRDGRMEVHAELVRVNGKVVKKNVISEEVVKKPVTKVVAKGTKRSQYASSGYGGGSASGSFLRPMSRGYVSSGYGYRWGEFHKAIDIATAIGTPVVASDGGTVTSARYDGSYGYAIVISHGNGYTTRYAHLSSMYVRPGQRVSKGQQIAASGVSGNSTGPHLHFEIIRNGSYLNPSSFVGS